MRFLCSIILSLAVAVVIAGCGSASSTGPRYSNRGVTSPSRSDASSPERGRGPAGQAPPGSEIPESKFLLGIRVDPEELSTSRFAGKWEELAQWVSSQGWNNVTVYAVQPTDKRDTPAKFYFADVAFADGTKLSDHGYAAGESFAKLVQAARPLNIKVNADITRLALSRKGTSILSEPLPGDELTKEQIGEICTALCTTLDVDRVCGTFFSADWAEAAMSACQLANKQFVSGDGLAEASASLLSSSGLALFPRSVEELAFQSLSFAAAGQEARPAWAGIVQGHEYEEASPFASAWQSQEAAQNALKYQAILAQPTGFLLDLPMSAIETVPRDLMQSLRNYALVRRERKKCNVILAGNPESGRPQVAAAVNGITSAGYSLAISREPLADADAFYILAYAEIKSGKVKDLPGSVANILGDQKRRVFVQVAGQLPPQGAGPGWDAVRRHCGIDNTEFEPLADPPGDATMEGTSFSFGVGVKHGGAWGTRVTSDHLAAGATALVLASNAAGEEIVLVSVQEVGSGGATAFVNGAGLDLPAAFPISNVLAAGGGLQGPTTALVAVSDAISAFLAANGETEVSIKLKGPDDSVVTKKLSDGALEVIQAEEATQREGRGRAGAHSTAEALPPPA